MVTRTKTIIITLFLLTPFTAAAVTDKKLFAQGNNCYRQGDFQGALEQYQKMNQSGPGVWFNRGSCFFEKGDYQQALICWYKAQKKQPFALRIELDQRIEKAREALHTPQDRSTIMRMVDRGTHMIPALFLQLIFLCCWFLIWICLFMERPVRFRGFALAVGLCVMALTGFLLLMHYSAHLSQRGIALKESVLFIGPHGQYHEIGSVAALDELQIKESREGWYKVEVHNCTGWIEADAIEVISV